jgi:hypothetical protein
VFEGVIKFVNQILVLMVNEKYAGKDDTPMIAAKKANDSESVVVLLEGGFNMDSLTFDELQNVEKMLEDYDDISLLELVRRKIAYLLGEVKRKHPPVIANVVHHYTQLS